MDTISFVLGIKSGQLRSSQLKDFVYRRRRLAKNGIEDVSEPGKDEGEDDDEGHGEGGEGERIAKMRTKNEIFNGCTRVTQYVYSEYR